MFGLKIYMDEGKRLGLPIAEKVIADGLGVEVSFTSYRTRKPVPLEETLWLTNETPFLDAKDKIIHLNNIDIMVADIHKKEIYRFVEQEMRHAQGLQISKGVAHYNDNLDPADATIQRLRDDLTLYNKLAADNGMVVHLENTRFAENPDHSLSPEAKGSLAFYQKMFDVVRESDLKNIGFCLDIGHAKCFSDDPLPAWVDFAESLQNDDVSLHFHLHNNDGSEDQHLNFKQADEQNLNAPQGFTGGVGYIASLQDIRQRCGGMKLFEVAPEYAVEHWEWIKPQLS